MGTYNYMATWLVSIEGRLAYVIHHTEVSTFTPRFFLGGLFLKQNGTNWKMGKITFRSHRDDFFPPSFKNEV